MITYHLFEQQNEIAHFCTSREGGVSVGNYASFNLSPFSGDNPEHFEQNLKLLADQLGTAPDRIIIPYQTHETEVRLIDTEFLNLSASERKEYLNGVDALITKLPNICIGVTTADCVPLLFFDPVQKVVAAAHAGWRGTCGRIAGKTIQALVQHYHCQPENILVTIGPSISTNAYNVGKELVENFELAGFDTAEIFENRDEVLFLDLWKANRNSLLDAGIKPEHIEISGICTFTEHEKFFSARRLGIKSGRMLSGIMLKEKLLDSSLRSE